MQWLCQPIWEKIACITWICTQLAGQWVWFDFYYCVAVVVVVHFTKSHGFCEVTENKWKRKKNSDLSTKHIHNTQIIMYCPRSWRLQCNICWIKWCNQWNSIGWHIPCTLHTHTHTLLGRERNETKRLWDQHISDKMNEIEFTVWWKSIESSLFPGWARGHASQSHTYTRSPKKHSM